jgi:UPF0755 protein
VSASRGRRLTTTLVVALLLLVAVVAGGLVVRQHFAGPADFSTSPGDPVTVQVHPGDTATDIGRTLNGVGVVASTEAFAQAATANPDSVGIQPGFYRLPTHLAGADAVLALLDPATRVENTVVVPEGLRVDQTVALLAQGTGLPVADFTKALADPTRLHLPAYADGDPEGFLFPATYSFPPDATATSIMRTMVRRFDQMAADTDLVVAAAQVGLTPREAITTASIVQAEVVESDFGKAARVIANRLAQGIPLEMDSTVNYALKSSDLTLTNAQIGVDSPYNTYLHAGLPPGPINSPGQAAVEAVLAPPPGDWLYFIAVSPGSTQTRFTSSYSQFLRWKAEFYAQGP